MSEKRDFLSEVPRLPKVDKHEMLEFINRVTEAIERDPELKKRLDAMVKHYSYGAALSKGNEK